MRLLIGEKEEMSEVDLDMNQAGEIYINDLISTIKNTYELDQSAAVYYYDHALGSYQPIQEDKPTHLPLNSLLPERSCCFSQM